MSAATDPAGARERLEPDDTVGNILCDLLADETAPTAPVQRVLNEYGDWAEARPSWQDYRKALGASERVVCRWPPADEHGEAILVRATNVVGEFEREFERVPVCDGTAVANAATVSGELIKVLTAMRGRPTLLALEDSYQHFLDGGSR